MIEPGRDEPRRDERGATAVIFAVVAVLLMSFGGLAVDLGNAYVRKTDVQSQADLAALAGGAGLPAATSTPAAGDPAVKLVAQYLHENQPQDDGCSGACRTELQLRQDLTDADPSNGQVYYGSWSAAGAFVASRYRLTVKTPPVMVKFGLAAVMGFSSSNVRADATAGVGSLGGAAEMPFYAVAGGCDYGSHLLSQPTTGKLDTATPPSPLAPPLTDGTNEATSMSLAAAPILVPLSDSPATITLTGSKLASVNRIAFLRGPADSPSVFEVSGGFSTTNGQITNIQIPATYLRTPAVWWVRVYKVATSTGTGAENKDGWSPLKSGSTWNMTPVQIGDDVLTCDGSSDGNFGSLKLPRQDEADSTVNGWLPNNIAAGVKAPLSLALLAGASVVSPNCTPGGAGVVYSTTTGTPTVLAGTNCVDTDTGLTSTSATAGLITGTSGAFAHPGRLDRDTTTGVLTAAGRNGSCGPGHTPGRRSDGGPLINNDTLTCFMTSDTTPVSAITSASYAGGTLLDASIYSSPRFCYVPVLGIKPVRGGSEHYGIVDIRPCFITGESTASTYQNQVVSADNGIVMSGAKVQSIRVVFFNAKALPVTGPIGDYIGPGLPTGVKLVD